MSAGWWHRITPLQLMWALWPSFLAAGVAEMLFFSCVDPFELHAFTAGGQRAGVYTLGFFFFWAITSLSSALTLFLSRAGSSCGLAPSSSENGRPAP